MSVRTAAVAVGAAFASSSAALAADKYSGFAELAAHHREGVDFRVTAEDRGTPMTVMAIHGGWMERGTSELARAVAAGSESGAQPGGWNLYLFESDSRDLHLTSTRFDEPRALALAAKSESCLSLHGFFHNETLRSIACVGGGDARRAGAVARALEAWGKERGVQVEFPCARFPGAQPENIVNRCRQAGVQVEMSAPLRDRVRADAAFAGALAGAMREAMLGER